MNKANTRTVDTALQLLELGTRNKDESIINMACRLLATVQRCGTARDTKTILAIVKDKNLSHKFYTENHCLISID
jgi:hypothetical protein